MSLTQSLDSRRAPNVYITLEQPAVRISVFFTCFFAFLLSCFCQNEIPPEIEKCIGLQLQDDKCTCLQELESNNPSVLAYKNYYQSTSFCVAGLDTHKKAMQNARYYWDQINYCGFRYLYSFLHLAELHKAAMDLDSTAVYARRLIDARCEIESRSANNVREAHTLLAQVASVRGDAYEAIQILQSFLESEYLDSLSNHNLAWFYYNYALELKETLDPLLVEKSVALNKKSIQILETKGNENPWLHGLNHFEIARYHERKGEHRAAYDLFRDCYQNMKDVNDEEGLLFLANVCNSISEMAYKLRLFQLSRQWAQRSIEIYHQANENYFHTASPYVNLAACFSTEGDFITSDSLLHLALDLASHGQIKNVVQVNYNFSKFSDPQIILKIMISLAQNQLRIYKSGHGGQNNLLKARSLYDQAYDYMHQLATGYSGDQSKYRIKLIGADLLDGIIESELLLNDYESLFQKVDRFKYSMMALKNVSDIREAPIEFSLEDLKSDIKDGEMLVEYVFSGDELLAFVLDSDSLKLYQLPIEEDFEDQLASYIRALKEPITDSLHFVKGHRLYNLIVAPLLSGNTRSMVIIPDGILGLLPFGTLLQQPNNPQSFLIRNIQISYLPSIQNGMNPTHRSRKSNAVGLFAPEFSKAGNFSDMSIRGSDFDSIELFHLAHAKKESEQIAKIWNTNISDVGKKQIVNSLSEDQVFHFGGHAILNSIDYRKSFLALGDNIVDDEKRLEFGELKDIQCKNELVVLSACNTGSGFLAKREGVLSLAASFLNAGARSVVSTLWAVNDQSSSMIMIDFHRNLRSGLHKSEALRQAKINYLEKADPKYKHPYYWAGIVIAGDVSPLSIDDSSGYLLPYAIAGITVFVFVIWLFRKRFF